MLLADSNFDALLLTTHGMIQERDALRLKNEQLTKELGDKTNDYLCAQSKIILLEGKVFCLESEVAYLRSKLEPKHNGGW